MFENSTYSEFRGPQTTSQFTQWWLVVVLVKYYVVVFCFGPIIFVGLVGNLLVFMLLVITDHKEEPNASSLCIRYTIIAIIVAVVLGPVITGFPLSLSSVRGTTQLRARNKIFETVWGDRGTEPSDAREILKFYSKF